MTSAYFDSEMDRISKEIETKGMTKRMKTLNEALYGPNSEKLKKQESYSLKLLKRVFAPIN